MKRTLAFAGAIALAVAQPAVSLAAASGGSAHARPAAAPASAPHAAPAGSSDYKAPLRFDVQPKSLSGQRFDLRSPAALALPSAKWLTRPWYGWQSSAGYLGFPALPGACYGNAAYINNGIAGNGFAGSSGAESFDTTLGSLVDGKSNLLSPPSSSNAAAFNGGGAAGSAGSAPFTFEVGSVACGGQGFTNF